MFKKITLITTAMAIGLPGIAAAGHIDDVVMEIPVTIPDQQGEWAFGLTALYMKRTNNDFHYATTDAVSNLLIDQVSNKSYYVDHHFEWGGAFDVTYQFAGPGRFAHFAWEHIDDSDNASRAASDTITLSGPAIFGVDINAGITPQSFLPVSVPGNSGWDSIQAKSKSEYNAVDLVFGQRMQFVQLVELAPFVGLRYASIDSRNQITAQIQDPTVAGGNPDSAFGTVKLDSDFCGLGPRAGFNAIIHINEFFSIRGIFAGSLLAGNADHKSFAQIIYTDNGSTVNSSLLANTRAEGETRVVPEVDVKLAVAFNNDFGGDTGYGIEVGFQAENYFGAENFSQYSYFDTSRHENDFGIYGPYVRVEFRIT